MSCSLFAALNWKHFSCVYFGFLCVLDVDVLGIIFGDFDFWFLVFGFNFVIWLCYGLGYRDWSGISQTSVPPTASTMVQLDLCVVQINEYIYIHAS